MSWSLEFGGQLNGRIMFAERHVGENGSQMNDAVGSQRVDPSGGRDRRIDGAQLVDEVVRRRLLDSEPYEDSEVTQAQVQIPQDAYHEFPASVDSKTVAMAHRSRLLALARSPVDWTTRMDGRFDGLLRRIDEPDVETWECPVHVAE